MEKLKEKVKAALPWIALGFFLAYFLAFAVADIHVVVAVAKKASFWIVAYKSFLAFLFFLTWLWNLLVWLALRKRKK